MSIEANIERIAVATEKLVQLLTPPVLGEAPKPEVAAEPKKRGRPAKAAEPVKPEPAVVPAGTKDEFDDGPEPVAAEPEPEVTEPVATSSSVDDFLDEKPVEAKPVTIEEVRAELKAYSDRNDNPAGSGRTKAQALLKTKTGFDTLTDLKTKGDQTLFRAVYDAAKA